MTDLNTNEATLGDDLIWTTAAIAKELRLPVRQATHLVAAKVIPVGRVGGRVVASKKKLREFLESAVNGQPA